MICQFMFCMNGWAMRSAGFLKHFTFSLPKSLLITVTFKLPLNTALRIANVISFFFQFFDNILYGINILI